MMRVAREVIEAALDNGDPVEPGHQRSAGRADDLPRRVAKDQTRQPALAGVPSPASKPAAQ